MPSGQDAVVGVARIPPATMNRCVALVSAMKPRWSSTTASSAPATFASILARIDGSRLLWWIFGSRQSGAGRRTLAVISVMPAASYTGALNSASTISVGPEEFSRGSMPEVSLTPRVSVSLMWTPSRMPFAARVRRIWSMISSSGGTGPKARAWAEARSRSRCSVSRKILPWYRRRPSHTASPPCTAESNGLTPAWSRWLSLPPTLTMRSRLRSSKTCSIRTSWGGKAGHTVFVQPREIRQAGFGERLEPGRQRVRGRPVRREAGGGVHAVVPVRGPHAVAVPRPGGPGQHPVIERHVQGPAQGAQHPGGVGEQVTGVHHGTAERLEDLRLLPEAEIFQGRLGAHPGVGGQQLTRVPDQVRVPQRRERGPVHLGQQVMRHVLGVADGDARGQRCAGLLGQHHPPVGRLARDDGVAAGVSQCRSVQVKGIKRLVADHCVWAVFPGPHQRRGHGARAGPHRDAGHSSTTLRSTSPLSILAKASSIWSSAIVSDTNLSSGRRPARCRSTSIGKSRLGRQSPYQEDLSAPPRPNTSSSRSSSRISGVGTPTSTTVPARSRA